MRKKVTKDQWEALIHWNFALVGGFLGAYAILLHMGNFGSAQTGNIMEMAASLVSGEWYDVLLRVLALPLFGGGVVVSYLLTNYTNINMRKLAILVDAAGLVASSLLPLKPVLVGLYPIFFCSAFQWGVYSSANGYNSATIFSSNNFKQAMLGWTQYFLTKDPEFKKKGICLADAYQSDPEGKQISPEFHENEFVILKPDQSVKKTLLGRVSGGKIVPLVYKKSKPYGVSPRNVGQYFMQEALMTSAEEAPLVILKGMAGTAKTFYSLAVGMEKVYNNPTGEYRRVIVCRPNAQFDDDIGFLPGDEKEKIAPLMRPVIDNLEQILDSDEKRRYEDEEELGDKITEIFERGIIQTEAMNFIRGRSIARTYLIIDEAQNMTPNQVKGIITRAGQGTKIILLGDPQQIDKPFLDERTNGLSYAAKHMIDSSLCWQITLSAEECERSALAMDAIKRL